jgi:nucleoside 2-deoxyribosyltransferase
VFVIMGYSSDPKLQDAYESFKDVCEEFDYHGERVDDTSAEGRIVAEIFEGIRKAAFVIADLTEQKPNVYYELGLAQGMEKPVIVTAFKGTTLPFDVHDIPTIFWESQKQLKELLRHKLGRVAAEQGRPSA